MDVQIGLRSLRSVPHHTQILSSSLGSTSSQISIVCLSSRWYQQRTSKITHSATQRRHAHSKRHSSTAVGIQAQLDAFPSQNEPSMSGPASMSCLPLSTLIRSYLITSVSSIPFLLRPSLAILSLLAHSQSPILNPDSNPLLKAIMKRTFYAQFCAGENKAEVRKTLTGLNNIGYHGVILAHAKEVVLSAEEEALLGANEHSEEKQKLNTWEINTWKENTKNTIELATRGDFVGIKFTGAGSQALEHLKATIPCSHAFETAVHEMCQLAEQRGVGLLFDAEQASLQQGIDNWTLYFMERYNKKKAVVYGTYQAYAKRTPGLLAQHIDAANKGGFILGAKLVRGAYLGSDPRHLFWDTIEQTHKTYDNLAKCLMERQYEGQLQPVAEAKEGFPQVDLVLASHNANSVATARKIRDEQARSGKERIPLVYGQLMGMADNVSCEIVAEAKSRKQVGASGSVEIPRGYKYLVWGTMGECMKYLLRRAHENKDAVSRTTEARQALGHEMARRMGLSR